MIESKFIVDKLKMTVHPEGGYYKEIYRSSEVIIQSSLPKKYLGDRNFSTSIFYMLEGKQISNFHKLNSDEIWHFYKGSAVILHCIAEEKYFKVKLGCDFEKDEIPQYVISSGTWFAAEIEDKESYSLVGCTVAPGFDFKDFELGKREYLLKQFPNFIDVILKFTKDEKN